MIYKAGTTDNWAPFDEMFDAIPVEKISIILMLTLARGTSMLKIKLNRWKPFVDRVHAELIKRGENADHLLRGLL